MKTLGKKIAFFREKAGLSQAALARACGWKSPSRVGNYELDTREPSLADLDTIAKALGIDRSALISDGSIDKLSNGLDNFDYADLQNQIVRSFNYPLIDWDDLEKFIKEPHLFSDPNRRIIMSKKKAKQGATIKMKGDSMSQLNMPTFPNGTFIILETKDFKIEPDKFYFIKLPDGTKTFKQLIRDANISYLKSLNDNYKSFQINEDECIFLGKAVDFYIDQDIN